MPHDEPAALAKAITAALRLPPARRAARWRELAPDASATLAAAGDAAVVEALDAGATYKQLAGELGVSASAINKAVSRHRARQRAAPEEEQPSCPTSPDNPSTT